MNRETIEKEARNFIEDFCHDHIDYTSINYEEDNYEAARNNTLWEFGTEIFMAGAEWRINSVWHDVQKELPAPDKTVIVEYIIDGERDCCFTHRSESPRVSVDKHVFNFYVRGAEIIRWAYLEDLLPDRKEVQP